MRRRDFIKVVGGSAVTWPLAARAQQPDRMPRVDVLMGLSEDNPEAPRQADALRAGLKELGWTEGRNIQINFHWRAGERVQAEAIAKQIVASQPDLIVTHTSTASSAAFQLTKAIPIVFVNVSDPIAIGLVSSFARPGGNVTGFTNLEHSMGGKWVEVLTDLDPRIRRVAILFNPETAPTGGKIFLPSFRAASATLGVEPIEAPVHTAAEIEQAIETLARTPHGSLIAMADIFPAQNRGQIISLALTHRLPLIGAYRAFADEGGLASYGVDKFDQFRRVASYVDRILKGAKPADLPVQSPTKLELVINVRTAKALGLTISHDFLLRADEVIE
jgi:putative ABC transport system substrate-binding protein